MEISDIKIIADKIKTNIQKVIIGKSHVIDILITTILTGGNVLLEDVPGTGKTVLAKSLAKSIGGDFKRVQFTPDLLPSDLTGINYYNQKQGEFVLRKGPLFTNILLADEINRATPRTQSSLLECMEEKQITIDGTTYKLDEPFFVIATENPIENAGTFPLPEAQLDRFLIRISMGYPDFDEGRKIIERFLHGSPMDDLKPVCTKEDLRDAQKSYSNVYLDAEIENYILKIIDAINKSPMIKLGISPRGMLAAVKMSQSFAAVNGREFVTPDDVKMLIPHVFSHRIILDDNVRVKGTKSREVLNSIVDTIEVPTEKFGNVR